MKRFALTLTAGLMTLVLAGCAGNTSRMAPIEVWPDMDRQDKFKPQTKTSIFSDGRASRPPVPGTIARGYLKEEDVFHTGLNNGLYAGKNPIKIDAETMKWGQTRFNTYCSPCHDRGGRGGGIVGQRSMWLPTSLHEDRVRQMADGELFTIITNGRRSMPAYRFQINEHDRWAIIAYVRALQRTSGASLEDVPQEMRSDLR